MFLDEVYEILQVTFGWTDCHLHQFGSGPRYHGPETEYYLCPYQVEEGEPGVPEEEVRLDEVIADPCDTLCHLYDFGDNWEHVIRLEAVAPWDGTAPAVCLDGRRDGPPEDCGGLGEPGRDHPGQRPGRRRGAGLARPGPARAGPADILDPAQQPRVIALLREHGLVTFTGITDHTTLASVAGRLMSIRPHRDASPTA